MGRKIRLTESQLKSLISSLIDEPSTLFEDVTSAVTFRKLAPKSKITFGKHKDLSVEEIR